MGANTSIAWCQHTFNAWIGCAKLSPACKNCYAADNTFTRVQRSKGRELWGVGAARHFFGEAHWREPLKWNMKAEKAGERHRVFCGSMMDVLEMHPDPATHQAMSDARHRLRHLIAETPHLDWLLLTKRPENFTACSTLAWGGNEIPPNVWVGATVESQEYADLRIPYLLKIPARVRFLSCEPLLGPIDLRARPMGTLDKKYDVLLGRFGRLDDTLYDAGLPRITWVIAGGESGPKHREHQLEHSRSLRDQCAAAGVAFFFKQLGERPTEQIRDGALLEFRRDRGLSDRLMLDMAPRSKGESLDEIPPDLRIRQFPTVTP